MNKVVNDHTLQSILWINYYLNYQKKDNIPLDETYLAIVDKFFMEKNKHAYLEYREWCIVKRVIKENPNYGNEIPFLFWKKHVEEGIFDSISRYLTIPSSSAAVERGFSIEKHVHNVLRNRLSDKNVDREMFFHYNKAYFHEVIDKENQYIIFKRNFNQSLNQSLQYSRSLIT